MRTSFIRYFLAILTLGLVATSSIISGCGSTPAPAATCSAISVPGFYAAWQMSTSGSGVSSSNLSKDKGLMLYFVLNSDNTLTNTQYKPDVNATTDQATGTAFEKQVLAGDWLVNNSAITINLVGLQDNTTKIPFTGTLSQSAYPGCVASFSISGTISLNNDQGQEVPAILSITAYQYSSTLDANNFNNTYISEDSNVIINATEEHDSDSGLSAPSPITITPTSANGGTYTATFQSQSIAGPFTFDNPLFTITFSTDKGTQDVPEYTAYNPITGEFIAMIYGINDEQQQVATLYELYQKQ